jgi:crotonobetainyl-CoA:carnitine CoA-transferase CaiB-like acyl-CoA transferase
MIDQKISGPQHTEGIRDMHATGPLNGRRVLELGGYVAAPFATMILCHLGADVIKVESLSGDPTRVRKANFVANNPGKRSIALNLRDERSRPVWESLVQSADVIIQNLDAAATEKLGIGYTECRAINLSLIYCHIKAFGGGPYSDRPATNPIVEALTGLMSITWADGKPARQAAPFYDQMAGMFAALEVAVALTTRDDDASSGYIETDLFETGLFSVAPRLADYMLNKELQGEIWGTAPYDTFQTSDGQWIFLGVVNDALWRSFCAALSLTEQAADPDIATSAQRLARKAYVDQVAGEAIGRLSRDEALARLRAAGIPCAPVNNFGETLQDEHVRSGGKLYKVSYDGEEALLPAFPVVSSSVSGIARAEIPSLGEHSAEIIKSLGYGDGDLAALIDAGVVSAPVSDTGSQLAR